MNCKQCDKETPDGRPYKMFCSKKCADLNYTLRTKEKKQAYDKLRRITHADKILQNGRNYREKQVIE